MFGIQNLSFSFCNYWVIMKKKNYLVEKIKKWKDKKMLRGYKIKSEKK